MICIEEVNIANDGQQHNIVEVESVYNQISVRAKKQEGKCHSGKRTYVALILE